MDFPEPAGQGPWELAIGQFLGDRVATVSFCDSACVWLSVTPRVCVFLWLCMCVSFCDSVCDPQVASLVAQAVKNVCSLGDPGLIPGWGRSPGEGNGNPLQYSCLDNYMDRGAWWATVHGGHKESDTTEWLTLSNCACLHGLREAGTTTGTWLCGWILAGRGPWRFLPGPWIVAADIRTGSI